MFKYHINFLSIHVSYAAISKTLCASFKCGLENVFSVAWNFTDPDMHDF